MYQRLYNNNYIKANGTIINDWNNQDLLYGQKLMTTRVTPKRTFIKKYIDYNYIPNTTTREHSFKSMNNDYNKFNNTDNNFRNYNKKYIEEYRENQLSKYLDEKIERLKKIKSNLKTNSFLNKSNNLPQKYSFDINNFSNENLENKVRLTSKNDKYINKIDENIKKENDNILNGGNGRIISYNNYMNNNQIYNIKNSNNNNNNHNLFKEINVTNISFTPGINEAKVSDLKYGKVSIQINGNSKYDRRKNRSSCDSDNLSELADCLVQAFDLDYNENGYNNNNNDLKDLKLDLLNKKNKKICSYDDNQVMDLINKVNNENEIISINLNDSNHDIHKEEIINNEIVKSKEEENEEILSTNNNEITEKNEEKETLNGDNNDIIIKEDNNLNINKIENKENLDKKEKEKSNKNEDRKSENNTVKDKNLNNIEAIKNKNLNSDRQIRPSNDLKKIQIPNKKTNKKEIKNKNIPKQNEKLKNKLNNLNNHKRYNTPQQLNSPEKKNKYKSLKIKDLSKNTKFPQKSNSQVNLIKNKKEEKPNIKNLNFQKEDKKRMKNNKKEEKRKEEEEEEDEEEEEIFNQIIKNAQKLKNKSKHIEIKTDLNIEINYNENEKITKLKIYNEKKNEYSTFKERDMKDYTNNILKNKKPKSILIPFNKENILIDDNYISAELKEEKDLCNFIPEEEEEEEEENYYEIPKTKFSSNSYIGKLHAMFQEDDDD